MRKILSIILCIVLIFSLTACSEDATVTETTAPAPTETPTVTETPVATTTPTTSEIYYELPFGDEVDWEAEQTSSDVEEAFKLAMDGMISGSLGQLDTSFNYDEVSGFRNYAKTYVFNRVMFSQLEYEITSVVETSTEFCYVLVNFTNVDVYNVIREGVEDWLAIVEAAALSDIVITNEESMEIMYECMIAQIGNYANDKLTSSAQVLMKYDEDLDTWQVMLSDTTLIAILGSEDALLEYIVW